MYIADTQNQRVRAVSPGGTISTLAGTGTAGFNGEIVLPRTAQLNLPHGVAADASGNWYVADTANNRVRKVQPGGNLFTIAGNGNASYFGDGGPGDAGSVNQPEGVAVDAAGNVYIADTLDHAVRKVTPDGVINTLAGTGKPGYSGDGGPASKARLSLPRAVAVDANGNVYVADTGNNQVRRIDPLGTITTVDTGGALNDPRGVAVDRAGNVYIADTGNRRVRRVSPGAAVTTIAGNGACCYSGDGGVAVECAVEPAVGRGGGRRRQRLRGGRGEQRGPNAGAGFDGPHGERGDQRGEQSAGSGGAGRTGGAVRHGARRGADGAVQRCGRTAAVRHAGAGGRGGAIRGGRRAGAGGGAECGRGVGACDGGGGADGAGGIHGGWLGPRAGGGGESGRNAERDGGSGGGRLGAIAVCDGRGADLAGGCRREVGAAPLPQPLAPVTVRIGGVAAEVRFAGGAPGQIAGVMQVNVVVPAGLSGTVPVVRDGGRGGEPAGRDCGSAVAGVG